MSGVSTCQDGSFLINQQSTPTFCSRSLSVVRLAVDLGAMLGGGFYQDEAFNVCKVETDMSIGLQVTLGQNLGVSVPLILGGKCVVSARYTTGSPENKG